MAAAASQTVRPSNPRRDLVNDERPAYCEILISNAGPWSGLYFRGQGFERLSVATTTQSRLVSATALGVGSLPTPLIVRQDYARRGLEDNRLAPAENSLRNEKRTASRPSGGYAIRCISTSLTIARVTADFKQKSMLSGLDARNSRRCVDSTSAKSTVTARMTSDHAPCTLKTRMGPAGCGLETGNAIIERFRRQVTWLSDPQLAELVKRRFVRRIPLADVTAFDRGGGRQPAVLNPGDVARHARICEKCEPARRCAASPANKAIIADFNSTTDIFEPVEEMLAYPATGAVRIVVRPNIGLK